MKNFLNIRDVSNKNLRKILSDAKSRKNKRLKYNTLQLDNDVPLKGKLLIQMFEKASLRTRVSFYLAIRQLGGSALTLRPEEIHLKKGDESFADSAKIISSSSDVFMLRTDSDKKLDKLKNFLDIPLINGLSPNGHPTQILSDIFTIEEIKKKNINKLNICWVGDSNNVLNSLIEASVKFSFKLNISCPIKYKPNNNLLIWAKNNKAKIKIFNNPQKAVKGADVLLTDKVISLNDKLDKLKKLKAFRNFRISAKLLKFAKKNCNILHCLPRGDEIDENVFNSKNSKIWLQASNRVHVQKSILLYCLDKLR